MAPFVLILYPISWFLSTVAANSTGKCFVKRTAHRPFPTVRHGRFYLCALCSCNAECRPAQAPERTELLPIKIENVPPLCHSDRSDSGVEESSTLDNEPTQDKICNLSGFLDSLRSLGMTCRGVVPFNRTGCIRNGASPWRGWMALGQRRYIVPCIGWYHSSPQVIIATWRAAGCRWNYGVIAPGNQFILIRCAKHHPYVKVHHFSHYSEHNTGIDASKIR